MVFLKGGIIPFLNRKKICCRLWDIHLGAFCVCWDRNLHVMHNPGISCSVWLPATQTFSFTMTLGTLTPDEPINQQLIQWLLQLLILLNITFGNTFVGFTVIYTENTFYPHASQHDSLKHVHTHIHGYILYVYLQTPLHFQHFSHMTLSGIRSCQELAGVSPHSQGRGTYCQARPGPGGAADPEGCRGPVLLHSSLCTHSAKIPEIREGKHPV